MKKLAITCALLSGMVVSQVWADAASDLKSRLDKVSSFHASFTQKVTDGSGNAVQDGQGDPVSYTHPEPTRLGMISYAVFCLKKKTKK